MFVSTTKTGNVFVDKIITSGGLNIDYKLYVKLSDIPDKKPSEGSDEQPRFNYDNKVVLEGGYGERLSLHFKGEQADLDNVEHVVQLKQAIQSYLKTRKYNKTIKKNKSNNKSVTVDLWIDQDYCYFENLSKTDLGHMLELLNGFCPAK